MSRRRYRYRPKPGTPIRLTNNQHWVLNSAGEDGVLRNIDRRSLGPLARWGLVRVVDRKPSPRSRRTVQVWEITPAGRDALPTAVIKDPPPRPHWRESWTVEVIKPRREWLVNGHRVRENRSLYRTFPVGCPDLPEDKRVAVADTLAEALDALGQHFIRCESRGHAGGTRPAIDLDKLQHSDLGAAS
jgi:hypothetical protein